MGTMNELTRRTNGGGLGFLLQPSTCILILFTSQLLLPPCVYPMQRIVELQESWRIMVEFNTHGGAGQQYQEHKVTAGFVVLPQT